MTEELKMLSTIDDYILLEITKVNLFLSVANKKPFLSDDNTLKTGFFKKMFQDYEYSLLLK